jgi:hypothetical protein
MDILFDKRVNCFSIIDKLPINKYLILVTRAYDDRGGLEGQREPLKTTTAIRIRKRMVDDLRKGAVLPPIVLGLIVSNENFEAMRNGTDDIIQQIIDEVNPTDIVIIDGMQRTTALVELGREIDPDTEIRIEYWISTNTNSLIYRMLVLNTGQVPWNLRRQIEVVFNSMVVEIREKVANIDVLSIDVPRRRNQAGQYQASDLIELFLVFGARKEKIDTKERLADEFTRLDFIEATADSNFTELFYGVLQTLVDFDRVFDKYQVEEGVNERFKNGRDLFSSQPARVGFITAIATNVLGRPGSNYSAERQQNNWETIKHNAQALLAKLDQLSSDEIGGFLDFNTLSEALLNRTQSSGKVGDVEREFFLKAFKTLIEDNFNLETLTPCWRAF